MAQVRYSESRSYVFQGEVKEVDTLLGLMFDMVQDKNVPDILLATTD